MEQFTTEKIGRMTETLKCIYERRAVRKYKDEVVDRATIEQVLDAGRMAPSAMNRQPWQFIVLTDRSLIQSISREIAAITMKGLLRSGVSGIGKLARAVRGLVHFGRSLGLHMLKDPVFYGAPVVIFLTAPRKDEWVALDIGMCAQNMMLAAASLGLDSCPVGFAKFVTQTSIYTRLGVPDSEEVLLAVILGYGDEHPGAPERRQDNIRFIE